MLPQFLEINRENWCKIGTTLSLRGGLFGISGDGFSESFRPRTISKATGFATGDCGWEVWFSPVENIKIGMWLAMPTTFGVN